MNHTIKLKTTYDDQFDFFFEDKTNGFKIIE